jgi:hypothetical protein
MQELIKIKHVNLKINKKFSIKYVFEIQFFKINLMLL